MSLWQKIKDKRFGFNFLTIRFSTGGKKIKIHSVEVPVIGHIGKKDEQKND